MSRSTRSTLFFTVVGLALVVLVTHAHEAVLPGGLARQIGHNSEALMFALLVAAMIHLRRRREDQGSSSVGPLLVISAVLAACGFLLQQTDWPSSVVTLNEPLLGAAFVGCYLCLPRSPGLALSVSAITLAVVIVFFDTSFVLNQAESLVPFILAPLALDIFDRTILQPGLPDRPPLRAAWMGVLVLLVVGSMLAARWARQDLQGPVRLGIDYSQRAAEAYWGWLLIHGYFSYWLGRRWRGEGASR